MKFIDIAIIIIGSIVVAISISIFPIIGLIIISIMCTFAIFILSLLE